MSAVKDKIRKQVDDILSSESEQHLQYLSDQLAAWDYRNGGWGDTSEEEKRLIRRTFDEMKNPGGSIGHEEMKAHLASWRERLGGRNE